MMKNNKPRIYAQCEAGCKWEAPHKADFLSLIHTIGVDDWGNNEAPFTHSLTIDRVVDEDVIIVEAPFSAYSECALEIVQNGSEIMFSVDSKPSEAIEIKIAIIPSTAVVEV